MPKLNSNGLELEYDTFGDPSSRPLLLVMGLGTQMIAWDVEFCEALVERDHYVIRFDNRDIGLSTKLDDEPVPAILEMMTKLARGEKLEVPYLISDMANDALGVIDALDLPAAHIVGASMGGMIVQSMALQAPDRVKSMTSIMSTTGRRDLPPAKPEAMARLMRPTPTERDEIIASSVETQKVIGSTGFPFDEERARERALSAYERCFYPDGAARQIAAITASPPRDEALGGLTIPTLVIHGDADPLVPIEAGIDTHESIPNSELLVIEGMGHDLPRGAWPQIVDGISKLSERAG